MNMALVKMNKLYEKGLYSPINYYLGLLALVKDGAEIPSVMGDVPEALLGMLLDTVRRHRESCTGEAGREEAAIIEGIVAWGSDTRRRPRRVLSPPRTRRSRPGDDS
jgi:hypothetical protein